MAPTKKSVSLIFDVTAFIVVFVLFLVIEFILTRLVDPVFRGFYCNDDSIRYPYQDHPAVPGWALFTFNVFVPLAVIAAGGVYTAYINKRNKTSTGQPLTYGHVCIPQDMVRPIMWYLWYLFGLGLTVILTNILKLARGELRPHFLAVCDPDWSLVECTDDFNNYIYVTNYTCRGDPTDIRESRVSFPSGHSSSTSFAMVFTALYLSTLPIIRGRSPWQLLLMVLALLLSLLCASSRLTDNRHHFTDVVAGLIIGAVIAVVVVFYNTRYFGHLETARHHHHDKDPEAVNEEVNRKMSNV